MNWMIATVIWTLGLFLLSSHRLDRVEATFSRFAFWLDRHLLAIPACFSLAMLIHGAAWIVLPQSPPVLHDEFSYLLGADTFAHGRLTNPTPLFADHFETFHVVMHPTYQSKFPPGQALALALGQVLGDPRIGAFGSIALACGIGYWMLRGAVSPPWALLGALIIATFPLFYSWGVNCWGTGMALTGGMLVAGAILRLRRSTSITACIAFGVGAGIFLNTRILEGAITCAIGLTWLLIQRINRKTAGDLPRCAAIALLPLLPVIGWMGYYNWRVTGNALTMPYMLHTSQYMRASLFTWQGLFPPKQYIHPRFAIFHGTWEVQEWQQIKTLRGFVAECGKRAREIIVSYGHVFLLPLLPMIPWLVRRNRLARLSLIMLVGFPLVQLAISVFFRPHYLAPVIVYVILIATLSLRRWHSVRIGSIPLGRGVVRTYVLFQIVFLAFVASDLSSRAQPVARRRLEIIQQLQQSGGKHLILVDYLPGPHLLFDWVFNGANIDSQPVIWARSLGSEKDSALLAHYQDRRQWRLSVRGVENQLTRIAEASASPPPRSDPSTQDAHEAAGR